MDKSTEFRQQVAQNIEALGADSALAALSSKWVLDSSAHNYSYNFAWMDRPIIQFPQDMVAVQEIIWKTRPDLIIETGIAHGGSLVFNASMLALMELADAALAGEVVDPKSPRRKVLGIDIDIRQHNRAAIEAHPMASRIQMLEGSSTDPGIVQQVREIAARHERVMVFLDSHHTHAHVLAELQAYAGLVSVDSYCVVFDTIVEDMPAEVSAHRLWGPGDNPKTAVHAFLKTHPEFEIDKSIPHKLLITVAPDGYLRRVSA